MLLVLIHLSSSSMTWVQGLGISGSGYSCQYPTRYPQDYNDVTFGYNIDGTPMFIVTELANLDRGSASISYSTNGGNLFDAVTINRDVNYVTMGASITEQTTDYSNALFIAVPQYNTLVAYSSYGTGSWTEQTATLPGTSFQREIISGTTDEGHEVWVTVSGGYTATYSYIMYYDRTSNSDTISFNIGVNVSNDDEAFRSVACGELDGKKVFIVVGDYAEESYGGYKPYYSYDGINWFHGPTMPYYVYLKVAYGHLTFANDVTIPCFVAVGENNQVAYLTSLDSEWINVNMSAFVSDKEWIDIAFGYSNNSIGLFMLLASDGYTMYSTNMINWYVTDNILENYNNDYNWKAIAYGDFGNDYGRRFVVINQYYRCGYYMQIGDIDNLALYIEPIIPECVCVCNESICSEYEVSDDNNNKLSTGAIIGIAFACAIVVAAIVIGITFGIKNTTRSTSRRIIRTNKI